MAVIVLNPDNDMQMAASDIRDVNSYSVFYSVLLDVFVQTLQQLVIFMKFALLSRNCISRKGSLSNVGF